METEFESQTSCLESFKRFIPEFDPDLGTRPSSKMKGSSNGGQQQQHCDIYRDWKVYVQTFSDLCGVENVPDEKRRPIFLLLAGVNLRNRLNQLGGDELGDDLDQTISFLNDYFFQKRNILSDRYNFFYKRGRRLKGEKLDHWRRRLTHLGEKCDFFSFTLGDAVALVMTQNLNDSQLRNEIVNSNLNSESAMKLIVESEESYEVNNSGAEHHLQPTINVELEWGEENEDSDSNITKDYLGEEEPSSAASYEDDYDIKQEVTVDEIRLFSPMTNETYARPTTTTRATTVTPTSPSKRNSNSKLTCACPNCQTANNSGRKPAKHNCHHEGCNKEYTKTSHLRAHLLSHSDVLPFACNWVGCEKRFYRSDQLKRHSRTHTGEKRFSCSVCSKAFSRSDHMSNHIKTHANLGSGNDVHEQAVSLPFMPLLGHMESI